MELDATTVKRISDMVRPCGLDEKQLCGYLAIEAEMAGPDSEDAVARAAGVDVSVVHDGLKELSPAPLATR